MDTWKRQSPDANKSNQEIHQWLTNAQMSQAAWNFAWELLMSEKKPEVQFFGASTIAIKVQKFWQEVPEEQVRYGYLKNLEKFIHL